MPRICRRMSCRRLATRRCCPPSPALTLPPFPLPVRAARPNQLMTPAHRAGVISLASGQPAADVLPVVHLKKAWRTAVDELDGDLLGYGPALGDPDLRLAIAERCAGWGFAASADDVLITTGGQQGIDLVARSLVGPGERVATEVPTFAAALDIFAASGARIVPVPTDEHGMDMSALAAVCERERPRLIYTVPTSHNPMGSVLLRGSPPRDAPDRGAARRPDPRGRPLQPLRLRPRAAAADQGGRHGRARHLCLERGEDRLAGSCASAR